MSIKKYRSRSVVDFLEAWARDHGCQSMQTTAKDLAIVRRPSCGQLDRSFDTFVVAFAVNRGQSVRYIPGVNLARSRSKSIVITAELPAGPLLQSSASPPQRASDLSFSFISFVPVARLSQTIFEYWPEQRIRALLHWRATATIDDDIACGKLRKHWSLSQDTIPGAVDSSLIKDDRVASLLRHDHF